MKYIFLLSGDYVELAKEEISSLFDVKSSNLIDRLLIIELKNVDLHNKSSQRLALTKSIYKFLFECKTDELIDLMKNFDWNSIYKDSFCLRIHNLSNNWSKNNEKISNKKTRTTSESEGDRSNPFAISSEKELAKYVWHSIKSPKVNLENPKTKIELFIIDDKVYCGLLVYANNEDFESRKAHLRPFPSSSSLHPKLARALVNITGIKENEILLDPFCGTGGFLIEAGLMDIKTTGYDINRTLIDGCKENLRYFKIKDYEIRNKNALNINNRFDYVVTDLPYGLNSNVLLKYKKDWKRYRLNKKIQKKDFIENLEQFYLKFLKVLRKKLDKKAVIVFPNYTNYKKLLEISKFKIEKEFSNYVHRSLTRKIVKVN